ncbi:hypothetical protein LXL04_040119 [Taraxacum kok-saghyz]
MAFDYRYFPGAIEFLRHEFTISKEVLNMLNSLVQLSEDIDFVYKDLKSTLILICLRRSYVIFNRSCFQSFVGEDSVCYRLVSSFLHLDTFDEDGRMIDFGCMPTVGEITRVLFNLALMEFDRRLCHKYPGIVFERFIGLVYIACTDDLRIDEYQVWDMIQDLGLSCEIDYTEPGDEPLECRQRMLWMLSREVVERSLVADKEKKVEPMGPSILALLNTLNPYGLMAVAHRYSVRDFRLLCRLAGAGYRVLARLDHRRPRRYSRLVVMGLKLLSPSYQLDFRLGKGQPLCPEAHGRLVRVLRA